MAIDDIDDEAVFTQRGTGKDFTKENVLTEIDALIEEFHCAIMSTPFDPESPEGFRLVTYTVGLASKGLPELCIVGVSAKTGHALLMSCVADLLKVDHGKVPLIIPDGHVPTPFIVGQTLDIAKNSKGYDAPTWIGPVGQWAIDEHLLIARAWSKARGKVLTAQQLVLPDMAGRPPSHPLYDKAMMDTYQPALSEDRSWTEIPAYIN